MFSLQLNQIRVDLSLTPAGPLLVRSGRQGMDPTRPDLECVRTHWEGAKSVYLPGSSLKGVLRSHAERLLATEGVAIVPTFDRYERLNQRTPGDEAYRATCPLGRTFGTLQLKGHVSICDHLPGAGFAAGSPERTREVEAANRTEARNGVAVDRLSGGPMGGALYDQELVVAGRFDGQILLRNVQLYQLALVLLAVRDLGEGWVRIGSGTTRGNGQVTAKIRGLTLESRAGTTPGRLAGAASLAPDLAPRDRYDLFGGDEVELPAGVAGKRRLLWDHVEVPEDRVDELAERLIDGPWAAFLAKAKEMTWNRE